MSNVSLIDGHIDYDEMTPQKALEMLNDVEFSEKYQGKQEYTDMLLFCKEAIEKQIPKKTMRETEETQFGGIIYFRCSCCGSLQMSKLNGQLFSGGRYRYCQFCGQALDWTGVTRNDR